MKSIVIVGGGTAGWMAANLMAMKWCEKGIKITLIESPAIGIIGVGEGSTPPLKYFMDKIRVSESEWMKECNATYKVGITFKDWSIKRGFESYINPFLSQTDQFTVPAFLHNCILRQNGIDVHAHPDDFFLSSNLIKNKLSPKVAENFPFDLAYAYHFDSSLLGQFLAKKAKQFGVVHQQAIVTEVIKNEQGYITELKLDDGELLKGDFFIDSTGFKGQLIQQALNVPFISFSENLFNDSAVVFPTVQSDNFSAQTVSTALKNGWAWSIPLTSRIGNGYVYSSSFCSADNAEQEFREHLGLLEDPVQARHLKMKVGRVARHWEKNCVAIGLSQGFIEPLEATALDLVQQTIASFIEVFDNGHYTEEKINDFNSQINSCFDEVRDYIVCHYRVSSRNDTNYWIENGSNYNIPDTLSAILEAWFSGQYISEVLDKNKRSGYFPNISWHCLLAGYGVFPDQEKLKQGKEIAYKYKIEDIHNFIRRCSLNFYSHKEALRFSIEKSKDRGSDGAN